MGFQPKAVADSMRGKFALLLYASAAVAAGVALSLLLLDRFRAAVPAVLVHQFPSAPRMELVRTNVYLYFVDRNSPFLMAEKRDLLHPEDAVGFAKVIVAALSEGSHRERIATLPRDTALRSLFIDRHKTAYVDFSESLRDHHPGGSSSEILTIYAIVNSLVLNIPQIESVKILLEGRESVTLCGHVDLRFPLKANMLLVR